MTHDFNKPPHSSSSEEVEQKKRIPVYILILVGIFLIALVFYMFAGMKPDASDAPPGHPNPAAEPATMNNGTASSSETATASDSDTATASDR